MAEQIVGRLVVSTAKLYMLLVNLQKLCKHEKCNLNSG